MKYLHEVKPGHFYLDHRLTPEVRAMLCAMASRAPLGGIKARYAEIVEAVAEDLAEADGYPTLKEMRAQLSGKPLSGTTSKPEMLWEFLDQAEDRLCEYPLHPKVQKFFDQFVGQYGHSSILELTGSPSTYTEGVSWYTAFRSFSNRLVKGQEFSTRAVRHRNWPMAHECLDEVPWSPEVEAEFDARIASAKNYVEEEDQRCFKALAQATGKELRWNPTLKALHEGWFEIFEAEVEAWRQEFTSPCAQCVGTGVAVATDPGLLAVDPRLASVSGKCPSCNSTGKKYPTADKEPFRPALDRARWALPGTIATGFSHTADLRTMARVINDGRLLAQASGVPSTIEVWEGMAEVYEKALPGFVGKGLKEAVYTPGVMLPSHLQVGEAEEGPEVEIDVGPFWDVYPAKVPGREAGSRQYLDEFYNQAVTVAVEFRCSLAVSRDWQRHRTLMPWLLDIVWGSGKVLQIHQAYAPRSEVGKAKLTELLQASSKAFWEFMAAGDSYRAMLCLPLGTLVKMSGMGGLRDVVYMLELRSTAVGANFEYQAQATEGLRQLVSQLGDLRISREDGERVDVPKLLGLVPAK